MTRIPTNRRYEELRRSPTWEEPEEIVVIWVEPDPIPPPAPPNPLSSLIRTSIEIAGVLVAAILPVALLITLASLRVATGLRVTGILILFAFLVGFRVWWDASPPERRRWGIALMALLMGMALLAIKALERVIPAAFNPI